jgi:type IV secretion system protein VirB2/type IV secretion system protein PtlA
MNKKTLAYTLFAVTAIVLVAAEPAYAIGGLDKVSAFMDNILALLRGISVTIVSIAFIWAGYKFLFQHADIMECAKILGGGLMIGSATELAKYMLG